MYLVLIAGCGAGEPDTAPAEPIVSTGGDGPVVEPCLAQAEALAARWREDGLPADVIERRYRVEVAGCAGPNVDPAMAVLVGRVNFDYTVLARQVIARTLDAPRYVHLVRDRSHKRRMAAKEPGWLAAYALGDEDGDLIPDDRDRCPATPPLVATTDDGCPTAVTTVRVGGTADDLQRYFGLVGLVAGMGCEGAPVPAIPVPVRAGRTRAGRTMVAVSWVSNQPAGCPVMIEVEGSYYGVVSMPPSGPGSSGSVSLTNIPLHLTLRSGNAVDPAAAPLVFIARAGDTDFLATPQNPAGAYNVVWRARAMNGGGLLSAWSGLRKTTDFGLTGSIP